MSQSDQAVGWTEDQWCRVRKTVADEAHKARVAAQFLPLFGPVDPGVVAVPDLLLGARLNPAPPANPNPLAPGPLAQLVQVNSAPGTFLTTISVQVPLQNHDVADPDLAAALGMFRRAGNVIARIEDALIFNGQPNVAQPPLPFWAGFWLAGLQQIYQVTGGGPRAGLLPFGSLPGAAAPPVAPRVDAVPGGVAAGAAVGGIAPAALAAVGVALVNDIVATITALEANGHLGPFACVLGNDLFNAICTPAPTLVLPRDRILPFLEGGHLLRTSTVPDGHGLVIALSGNPVELVVGSDISVQYLQTTLEPRMVFRVSERIALRAREWDAVGVLHP